MKFLIVSKFSQLKSLLPSIIIINKFNRPINNYKAFNYKYGKSGVFLCKLIGGLSAPFVFLMEGLGGPLL